MPFTLCLRYVILSYTRHVPETSLMVKKSEAEGRTFLSASGVCRLPERYKKMSQKYWRRIAHILKKIIVSSRFLKKISL